MANPDDDRRLEQVQSEFSRWQSENPDRNWSPEQLDRSREITNLNISLHGNSDGPIEPDDCGGHFCGH